MTGLGSVHHTQCWSVHLDCARGEIHRLQRALGVVTDDLATIREELAATRRQLLLVETQRLDLIRLSENRDRGPLTARTEETP